MNKSTKVKILYIITKLELGGAQRYLLALMSGLDKDKYEVGLITAKEGYWADRAEHLPGVKVHRSRFLERPVHIVNDLLALIEIFLYIRRNRVAIVHTHSSKAGILGRLAAAFAGTKIIIHTVHGWSFHGFQNKFSYLLYCSLERICARVSDVIFVVSEKDMATGTANRIIPKQRYILARFGMDFDELSAGRLSRPQARQRLGLQEMDYVIGMIACFKPQKSPLDFVRLAELVSRSLPSARFVMMGDGELRGAIAQAIATAGLAEKVLLTGWREDIAGILSAWDVFVLTSRWEGLPIAVMEAMLMRIPVVVTDTGGVAEIVRPGETGMLVQPGDVQMMADKVLSLYSDRNLVSGIIERASSLVSGEGFTRKSMLGIVQKVYTECLSTTGR